MLLEDDSIDEERRGRNLDERGIEVAEGASSQSSQTRVGVCSEAALAAASPRAINIGKNMERRRGSCLLASRAKVGFRCVGIAAVDVRSRPIISRPRFPREPNTPDDDPLARRSLFDGEMEEAVVEVSHDDE